MGWGGERKGGGVVFTVFVFTQRCIYVNNLIKNVSLYNLKPFLKPFENLKTSYGYLFFVLPIIHANSEFKNIFKKIGFITLICKPYYTRLAVV